MDRKTEFNLTELDYRLIEELKKDPLASSTKLGKVLYINRNSVSRRIQYLLEQDIISIRVTRNITNLPNTMMLYFFFNAAEKHIDEVSATLCRHPGMENIVRTLGDYDLMAFGRFRHKWEFLELHRTYLSQLPGVASIRIMTALTAMKISFPIIATQTDSQYKTELQLAPNDLDLRIMEKLEENPREKITAMANDLAISRQTLNKRIAYLLDMEFISIYTFVNPAAFGYTETTSFLLHVTPDSLTGTAEKLARHPDVQDVIIGMGCCELLVLGLFRSRRDRAVFAEKLKQMPGVLSIETVHVQKNIKSFMGMQ